MTTIITNVTELQAMKDDLAGDYKLGNDIDASATSGWNGGDGFEPIGDGTQSETFVPTSDHSAVGTWTVFPASPTTKYDKIDEAVHDSDTTYVQAETVGAYALFGFAHPTIPSDAIQITVRINTYGDRLQVGTDARHQGYLCINGERYLMSSPQLPPAFFSAMQTWVTSINPATGVAWTPDDVNDLDAFGVYVSNATQFVRETKVWLVIGYQNKFHGTFDGAGYTISGLYINRDALIGLLEYVSGATISDVTLADIDFTGYQVGGLAWDMDDGTITGVSVSGSIVGEDYAGGLVGYPNGTTIEKCHSSCSVSGVGRVGGLAAQSYNATFTKCYATGNVAGSGTVCVGGLIGLIDGGTTLTDVYARGDVSAATPATANSGGLVGYIDDATDSITNGYSTGSVPGAGTVGGLIGYRKAGSTLTACFWDTTTSGTSDGVGTGAETGVTGKTTALMNTGTTFIDAGWDFIIIWAINATTNGGYPFFWAMPPEGEEALPDAPRRTVAVQDKITLESIRNIEMAAGGRFYIDEEGNAVYKSRYARNA